MCPVAPQWKEALEILLDCPISPAGSMLVQEPAIKFLSSPEFWTILWCWQSAVHRLRCESYEENLSAACPGDCWHGLDPVRQLPGDSGLLNRCDATRNLRRAADQPPQPVTVNFVISAVKLGRLLLNGMLALFLIGTARWVVWVKLRAQEAAGRADRDSTYFPGSLIDPETYAVIAQGSADAEYLLVTATRSNS